MTLMQTLIYLTYNILLLIVPPERDPHPDKWLNISQLTKKYGYGLEEHSVTTEDGYILKLYRLSSNLNTRTEKPPVLVMHGLLFSSSIWVGPGPDRALGYILADAGYDVWLGNARGNRYSRNHIELDPDTSSKFWDFSFNEMGYYDLPALIDHIIENTGQKKIYYIGHSQGTTSFLAMAATKPEYNRKIILSVDLAPVAFPKKIKASFFRLVATFQALYEIMVKSFRMYELFAYSEISSKVIDLMSRNNSPLQKLYIYFINSVCGFDDKELDTQLLPVLVIDNPGAGFQQLLHYTQMINSDIFRKYDYGVWGNFGKYGQITPPVYNLTKVVAPVALFYSENDYLSQVYDVDKLSSRLPNLVYKFKVEDPEFNHVDFLWAKNVVKKLYAPILKLMSKYK